MATIKGYKGIMTKKGKLWGNLDVIDKRTGKVKAAEKLRKVNEKGYSELLLSML